MQQILGTILLVFSLALGTLILLILGFSWVAAHIPGAKHSVLTILSTRSAESPEHAVAVVADAQEQQPWSCSFPQAFISGKLAGLAGLETPLSHRTCLAWNVTIYHWSKTENHYDAHPIWSRTVAGAVEIPFERTRYRNVKQTQQTSESGIWRASGNVVFKSGYVFPHRSQLAPLTTIYLNQLQQAQLPEAIAATIAKDLDEYGVKEQYLTTGDAIQGMQTSQQFTFGPGAEDRSREALAGCLLVIVLICLGFGALLGYRLLS